MADPDLELRGWGGGGLDLLALSAIFPSVISSFLTQNKGGAAPPGPFPRSTTDKIMTTMEYAAEDENFIGFEGTE